MPATVLLPRAGVAQVGTACSAHRRSWRWRRPGPRTRARSPFDLRSRRSSAGAPPRPLVRWSAPSDARPERSGEGSLRAAGPGSGNGGRGNGVLTLGCVRVSTAVPSTPSAYTSTSLSRMVCRSSPISTRLFVSFPSEMTRIAFLGCLPMLAMGTASATASYIAVPPAGLTRATALLMARSVGRPPLHQVRAVRELEKEQLVVCAEEIVNEPVDRRPGRRHLVRRHAAARVEHEPEADGHAVAAEVARPPAARRPRKQRSLPCEAQIRTGRCGP